MNNQERIISVTENYKKAISDENISATEKDRITNATAKILLDLTSDGLRSTIKLFHPSEIRIEPILDENEPLYLTLGYESTGNTLHDYNGGYLTIIPEKSELISHSGEIPAMIAEMLKQTSKL